MALAEAFRPLNLVPLVNPSLRILTQEVKGICNLTVAVAASLEVLYCLMLVFPLGLQTWMGRPRALMLCRDRNSIVDHALTAFQGFCGTDSLGCEEAVDFFLMLGFNLVFL